MRFTATILLILLMTCSSYLLYSFLIHYFFAPGGQYVVVAVFIAAIQLSKIVGVAHIKSLGGIGLTALGFGFCLFINVFLSDIKAENQVDLSFYDHQIDQIDTIISSAQATTWRGSLTQSAADIIKDANLQRSQILDLRDRHATTQISSSSTSIKGFGGFVELLELFTLLILMLANRQETESLTDAPVRHLTKVESKAFLEERGLDVYISETSTDPKSEIKKAKRKISQLKYRLKNKQIKPDTYEKRIKELQERITDLESNETTHH